MKIFFLAITVIASLVSLAEEVPEVLVTNHVYAYGNVYESGNSYSSFRVVAPVDVTGVVTNGSAYYRYEYCVDWLIVGSGKPISSYDNPIKEWIFNGVVSNKAVMMICPVHTNENGFAIFSGELNVPDVLVGDDRQCELTWCHAISVGNSYSGYTVEYGKLGEHSFDDVTAISLPDGYVIPKFSPEIIYSVYEDAESPGYGNFESMGFWNLREMTISSRPYVFLENDNLHNMKRYLVYADQINVPQKHYGKWQKVLRNMGYGGRVHVIGSDVTNGLHTVSLAITNVVLHCILNNVVVTNVTPQVEHAGFVNVITEIKGGSIAVPSLWAECYPTFTEKYGSDFSSALMKKSGKKDSLGKDMFVWQDYIAGTDPTNPDDKFTASVTVMNGKVVISYSPELDDDRKNMRKYTVWGKKSLVGENWVVVPEYKEAEYNFFKVTVEMR